MSLSVRWNRLSLRKRLEIVRRVARRIRLVESVRETAEMAWALQNTAV